MTDADWRLLMEHRWSDRTPSSFEVILFHNNIPVVTCKARNISIYGMYVLTGPVRYERNSVLEVEFVLGNKGRKKRYRIPAYVIHQTHEGLGLMFNDDNQDTVNYIKNIIQITSDEESSGKLLVKNNQSYENNKSCKFVGVG